MEENTELLRLEEIVDQLLSKYSQLKADFHALEETLSQRDAECAELKGKLDNLNTEQTAVSNRVSGLLDRISQWESEQVSAEPAIAAGDSGEGAREEGGDSGQGSLFQDEID